jgi:hypothetical protein
MWGKKNFVLHLLFYLSLLPSLRQTVVIVLKKTVCLKAAVIIPEQRKLDKTFQQGP